MNNWLKAVLAVTAIFMLCIVVASVLATITHLFGSPGLFMLVMVVFFAVGVYVAKVFFDLEDEYDE